MAEKNYFLNSKAAGTWEYEILEGKVKVKHPICLGFNEIPESHRETLEDDPGYKAKIIKGVYKELKAKEALAAGQKEEKTIDRAKDVSDAKDLYKTQIAKLKEDHKAALKKAKEEYKAEFQKLTDMRGEALKQVKGLEAEKVTLSGQLAELEAGSKKALEIAKSDSDDFAAESAKELEALKVSSEKKIKALEGEKKALDKQVKDLKAK